MKQTPASEHAPRVQQKTLNRLAMEQNPEAILDDPLSSVLGPGYGQLLGKPDDEVPAEIAAIFSEHDLCNRKYRVMLTSVPEGSNGDDGNMPVIKSWTRCIPSVEYIALEYGPGNYRLRFSWVSRSDGGSGPAKSYHENLPITISDKFEDEYKDYQFSRKLKAIEDRRRKVQDMKLQGTLEAGMDPLISESVKSVENTEQAAIKYVEGISSMAQKLGFSRSGGGIDWEKLLPVASLIVPSIIKMMSDNRERATQESNRFMTMMMGIMTQNNQQLVEVMKSQQSPKGADLTKEMFEMIRGAIDVKEMIADHGKESLTDRIFNLLVTVAPQIMEVAKLSAMQRQTDPRYQAAKMYARVDGDIQEAAHSPQAAKELYGRLDEQFGWKQADVVLGEVGGIARPADAPRKPQQELPADMRDPSTPSTSSGTPGSGTAPTAPAGPAPMLTPDETDGDFEDDPPIAEGL